MNSNEFRIEGDTYRWEHNYDGRGSMCLTVEEYDMPWTSRVGALRLRQGEWVFTRGAFADPYVTGADNIHDAKKAVQVWMTMLIANRKKRITDADAAGAG